MSALEQLPAPETLEGTRLDRVGPRAFSLALGTAIIAFALAIVLGWRQNDGMQQFMYGYYMAWVFFFCIAAGSLYFLLLHHAFRAMWSIVVRRLAEAMAANLVLMAVLLIPILGGLHLLFSWTSAAFMHSDKLLISKLSFLNTDFFTIRCIIYFVVLAGMAIFLRQRSNEQDTTGSLRPLQAMHRMSRWSLIVAFWTINFVGVDFIMAIDPKWFSYVAPVYFFTMVMVSVYAALPLLASWLQTNGILQKQITKEHYHDLGKWLLAWTLFWGYIAFCQYVLIWYANMPEETGFYQRRIMGPWGVLAAVLLAVHLFIPGFGLMSRHAKRNRGVLTFWCGWILMACYLDVFWLIAPQQYINTPLGRTAAVRPTDPYHFVSAAANKLLWMPLRPSAIEIDLLCLVGMGGLFLASVLFMLRGRALLPVKDPRLAESLAFENY